MKGLSSAEAAQALRQFGSNELSRARRAGVLVSLAREIREPMVLLLLVCAGVYFSFGDVKEALILMGSVLVVIGITFFQERKTENALEALKQLSSPRASVFRDGVLHRVSARDVVPGDQLLLEEGDRIAADAELVEGRELLVDESLLTGESRPVLRNLGEKLFAGTLVVRGHATAVVRETGARTEFGKIGRALDTITVGHSPLRLEIHALVKVLALAALGVCSITVVGMGILRDGWREGLLGGLTLAMALLPEEFPVVLTIFFALGAYRMSRQRVLTRRLPSIEALGSATVLCADKTGTLTENRMRVTHFQTGSQPRMRESSETFEPADQDLAGIAALACPETSLDPVDQAARAFGEKSTSAWMAIRRQKPLRDYPYTADRPLLAEAYAVNGGGIMALKGSPEAVAKACRWTDAQRAALPSLMEPLTSRGLRVIAVGQARLPEGAPPLHHDDVVFEFVGLLGMTDPLRPGIRKAVGDCESAGIRVVMITGDNHQTATVIAGAAGIKEENVYARFKPLDKLALVQALREKNEIVAMTGDGVNDAPALKAAHIGIAMGERGTDVAREAADLVVLDDNFVSIVGAIRLGRRIYANLQKSLGYLLSVHVPIAGMALVPLAFGWPLLFSPVHIVFLEIVIDPACSLVFEGEPEDGDVMKHPPRARGAKLLNRQTWLRSVFDGSLVLLATAVVFGLGLSRDGGAMEARALGFVTLVLGNLTLILVNRTHRADFWTAVLTPNKAWWSVAGGTLAALAFALYNPWARTLFQFSFLHADDILLCASALVTLLGLLFFSRLVLRDLGKNRGRSVP